MYHYQKSTPDGIVCSGGAIAASRVVVVADSLNTVGSTVVEKKGKKEES